MLLHLHKQPITSEVILKITLVLALAIPFLLPEMHERYFYLADIVSIIYAFYFPRYFFIAVVQQLASLLSYTLYFYNSAIIDLSIVTLAILAITFIATADLVHTLYPATPAQPAVEGTASLPSSGIAIEDIPTPLPDTTLPSTASSASSELRY